MNTSSAKTQIENYIGPAIGSAKSLGEKFLANIEARHRNGEYNSARDSQDRENAEMMLDQILPGCHTYSIFYRGSAMDRDCSADYVLRQMATGRGEINFVTSDAGGEWRNIGGLLCRVK
jgi:hypothetical protein